MTILDTNCLIRFFTKDDEHKANKVRKLLESMEELYIPNVVFHELEYVLSGGYKTTRIEIIKIFHFLISQKKIKVSKEVKQAIKLFEDSKLDMADCLVASHSILKKDGKLASFDKKLIKVSKTQPYRKL